MKQALLVSIFVWISLSSFAQNRPIKFSTQLKGDSILLLAKNVYPCPFYIKQEVVKAADKIKADSSFLLLSDSQKVITAFPASDFPDSLEVLGDYVDFETIMGNPFESKPDSHAYCLPYPIKEKHRVIQGYEGRFSHRSEWSRYAIDFAMNIGDSICAARSGLVCWVVEHNNEGGRDRSYLSKANTVIVYHEDGTFAHYAHLCQDGALVEVGDTVKQGQVIALSGNTGFTTRPHLHFVVRKSTLDGLKAIPTAIIGLKPKKRFRSGYCAKRRR
jgi:murein DD-endopeptidase MepM/ murein hydrolase activator NlpD